MADVRTMVTDKEKDAMLYLKSLGMKNPEIERITGRSRNVVQLVTSGTYTEYREKQRAKNAERKAMLRQAEPEKEPEKVPEYQITVDYRLLVEAFTEALQKVFGK